MTSALHAPAPEGNGANIVYRVMKNASFTPPSVFYLVSLFPWFSDMTPPPQRAEKLEIPRPLCVKATHLWGRCSPVARWQWQTDNASMLHFTSLTFFPPKASSFWFSNLCSTQEDWDKLRLKVGFLSEDKLVDMKDRLFGECCSWTFGSIVEANVMCFVEFVQCCWVYYFGLFCLAAYLLDLMSYDNNGSEKSFETLLS